MPNTHALVSQSSSYILTLFRSHIKGRWLNIPASNRHLFPNINMASIMLDIDGELVQTKLRLHLTRKHNLAGGGLTDWFKTHTELKVGDKLRITVIEPMKKYRLEIVK